MLLQPSKTKYRKYHKGRIHGTASRGDSVVFGDFGIKALEPMRVTARQIESSRKVLTGTTKRQGKIWIRIFPDIPVTSKPAEVRMGKGKGSPDFWVFRVKPGTVLFELNGIPEDLALEACRKASAKLPIKTKIVRRREF